MVRKTGIHSWVESYQRLKNMVHDTSLLKTKHYKVCTKGKVEQSRERSSDLPYTTVLWLLKREPLGHSRLQSSTLLTYSVEHSSFICPLSNGSKYCNVILIFNLGSLLKNLKYCYLTQIIKVNNTYLFVHS